MSLLCRLVVLHSGSAPAVEQPHVAQLKQFPSTGSAGLDPHHHPATGQRAAEGSQHAYGSAFVRSKYSEPRARHGLARCAVHPSTDHYPEGGSGVHIAYVRIHLTALDKDGADADTTAVCGQREKLHTGPLVRDGVRSQLGGRGGG